jgi:hypothetical protein
MKIFPFYEIFLSSNRNSYILKYEMSNEVIDYSSIQTISNQRLQNSGQVLGVTTNNINTFTINNPYFENVGSIINKFGPPPSPYYNITFFYKISGTLGFEPSCHRDMILYLNNNELIKATNYITSRSSIFEEKTFEVLVNSSQVPFPLSRTFNFSLGFTSLAPGVQTICRGGSYTSYVTLNIEFKYYGQIFIGKFCSENFNDPICLNFCNQPENTQSCVKQSLSWCFDRPLQPQFSRFFNISNCKTFVKNYMTNNISHPQYDRKFREICKTLNVDGSNYKNYTQGQDPQFDLEIKNICACNLNDSIYNNFFESFAAEIPTIKSANFGSKKCIFPECSTSEYKPTEILGYNTCPKIECINVTQIDNNGRIIGGLTINQSSDCPNIQDPRRPCGQDGECGVGEKCLQGLCVDDNVCRVKSNCDVNSKCFNNICVRDDFCTRDIDCGDGLKCSRNICVKDINVGDVKQTLIIFIIIGGVFLVLLTFILLIFFIKKLKRNK